MRLMWEKIPDSAHRFVAETARFRYLMAAPPRGRVVLCVQHADEELITKPIDQRTCRSRRSAERIAQRFESNPNARRLR
jgi:hypothetical protein